MIALLAHHRLYNIIAYSLEHYCLLYVYRLIYREGKGGHSGIVCKASAQGHSVTLWKAKGKGTLYLLRNTNEECVAMPLTHAKASGHSLHIIDYTIILHIVWSIIVCCMYIG